MLWILILKLLDLFEAFLDYFVTVEVTFTKGGDYQWGLETIASAPTEKGWNVLDAVVTIVHTGLDFVAQFMTLLPAMSGVSYNNVGLIHVT